MQFDKEAELVEEPVASIWRRRLALVGGALVLGAALASAVLWVRTREAGRGRNERRAAVATVAAEVQLAKAAAEAKDISPAESLRRLEALAAAQRRLAVLQPSQFSARLEEVRQTESRLAAMRAQLVRQDSETEERLAREKLAAGDTAGAADRLRGALELQHQINGAASGAARDFDRELRLQRELAELTAEPKRQAIERKARDARAALAAARWDEALGAFREARELQDRLNREFPRTRYSDLEAIARFDAEIAALTADGLDAQVNEHVQRARELRRGARTTEAVSELAAAATLQRQLNERFGRSRFVSMERLEQIETERQTILAEEPLNVAWAKEEEAQRFLRKRQIFQAQRSVREALEALEEVRTRLPKAPPRDDEKRAALAFLNSRSADLAAVQDRCYDQLAPFGAGGRAMLRAEVCQEDFAKIMGTNPSRNPGRALPVDSVSFPETEEFCRRLTWVLGWRVRLPTENEMRVAAATGDGADFRNVNGGLAEWIASAGGRESPTASVWSGSGESTSAPRTERVRTRGFRVIVEVDLAHLGEIE